MQTSAANLRPLESGPSIETFFLGELDFDVCAGLQQRLVYEAGEHDDGRITVVVCEHRPVVTLGRLGSRDHIRVPPQQLTSRKLTVRWTNRGGGCMLHLPGQLAVYPIVPLQWHGWTVGEYMHRFQQGLLATLAQLGMTGETQPKRFGIWGRTGQVVAFGVAVKNWTTYHGAFINVDPAMREFRGFQTDPADDTPMTSLVVERQQRVKMATVRAALAPQLAAAFGCERFHIHTSHPFLSQQLRTKNDAVVRAL